MLQRRHAVVVRHGLPHGERRVPGDLDVAAEQRRHGDQEPPDEGLDRGVVGGVGREPHQPGQGGGPLGQREGVLLR